MALPDQELNTVLDRFNQKCLEDPDLPAWPKKIPSRPLTLWPRPMSSAYSPGRGRLPFGGTGQKLSMEELSQILCQ